MATQSQYNTAIQPYRNISIKLEVLDFNYYILDEISGVATSANFSIDADSDIRRTCNINMILKDDYSSNPVAKSIYWQSGNPFWFDKYLRINIGIDDITTGETVWNNQGIYLINEPSLTYNATTNELSFEGLDLMADLTGLRNGNLDGISHEIPVGSVITSAIKSILQDNGFTEYILNTPPQSTTPYEVKTNAGGTSYDLLSQLRDINPDWEMFFDVNGVFYFQPIASNATSANTVTPFVDMETFNLLHASAELDTSFEDVKNYIEVYGSTIESNYAATWSRPWGQDVEVYINESILENIDENGVYISTTVGDLIDPPELFQYIITRVLIFTDGGQLITSFTLDDYSRWKYMNQSYVFKLYKELDNNNNTVYRAENIGYVQPMGVAWDDNVDSPFYVGVYSNSNEIKEWDAEKTYNRNEFCYYNGMYYQSRLPNNKGNLPVITAQYSDWWRLLWRADGYTDAMYNKPQFERQVRIVLSGGEYDNIYSNELAMQRAKYELYLRSAKHDNIRITLVPIYWMDVNQIIEYQMPNESEPSYWLVKDVSTDFSVDGNQTITAVRYYFNR